MCNFYHVRRFSFHSGMGNITMYFNPAYRFDTLLRLTGLPFIGSPLKVSRPLYVLL